MKIMSMIIITSWYLSGFMLLYCRSTFNMEDCGAYGRFKFQNAASIHDKRIGNQFSDEL